MTVVTFDTSAHNRLLKDGPASEPMLAGLTSGVHFRFAGLSIDELFSTPDPTDRAALLASCSSSPW